MMNAATDTIAQQAYTKQRSSIQIVALFVLVIILVVLGAIGLEYYTLIEQPAEMNNHATAVTQQLRATQVQINTINAPEYVYAQTTKEFPTVSEPLTRPSDLWREEKRDDGGFCRFENNVYHIHSRVNTGMFCFNRNKIFSNFIFEVQINIISSKHATIYFRSSTAGTYGVSVRNDGLIYILRGL